MKSLRQIHLYLGCLFAPLIVYFALSGVWQVFRLNDVPKDEAPSKVRFMLHELSKPHTHSTAPDSNPKTDSSSVFNWFAATMGVGLFATTLLGVIIAVRSSRSVRIAWIFLALGTALPILFLFLR